MNLGAEQLLQYALALPAAERAALVDGLLSSFDRSDHRIDELWVKEASVRLAAFAAGKIKAFPAEQVFAELDSK